MAICTQEALTFTNGNIHNGWCTPFGMPYKPIDTGAISYANGVISSRHGAKSIYDLTGFQNGLEAFLGDIHYKYHVDNGSSLCGCGWAWSQLLGTCDEVIDSTGFLVIVDLTSVPGGWSYQFWFTEWVEGVDYDEFDENGTFKLRGGVTDWAGDDNVGFNTQTCCYTICCAPSMCFISNPGSLWVEGNDIAWSSSQGYKHNQAGNCIGTGGTPGAVYIDTNHYLNWANSGGNVYRAPWRLCQFCDFFNGMPPANPSPGPAYAGAFWVEQQSDGIMLAYIGCDGNKYLSGYGCEPDKVP